MEKYDLGQFYKDLEALGISLSEKQIQQFVVYYEMLVERNKDVNLTAITDFDGAFKKHFIDIGTGAGFPGIPLKIAFPHLKVTLVDSLHKRVVFLGEVIDRLGLAETEAIHGRAEDHAKPKRLRERYDICVSRAVANLSTLLEYCLPYVKIGGSFVAYKSEKAEEELQEAAAAIRILGGEAAGQVTFMLPGSDIHRSLVTIAKVSATPAKYPRKAGTADRKPLQ